MMHCYVNITGRINCFSGTGRIATTYVYTFQEINMPNIVLKKPAKIGILPTPIGYESN